MAIQRNITIVARCYYHESIETWYRTQLSCWWHTMFHHLQYLLSSELGNCPTKVTFISCAIAWFLNTCILLWARGNSPSSSSRTNISFQWIKTKNPVCTMENNRLRIKYQRPTSPIQWIAFVYSPHQRSLVHTRLKMRLAFMGDK